MMRLPSFLLAFTAACAGAAGTSSSDASSVPDDQPPPVRADASPAEIGDGPRGAIADRSATTEDRRRDPPDSLRTDAALRPADGPSQPPDATPSGLTVPPALVQSLSAKPYVEQNCQPTTYPGWPYQAQICTYSSGGLTATVTVADPSPDRAARWIVDSASLIPALAKLDGKSPTEYEQGLVAIGRAMLLQSSRIFPLAGGIIENQGAGYINYSFRSGVTTTCSSGCYCRINSLHRTEWCQYQSASGGRTYDGCIATVGSSGFTAGWANECLQNHVQSWTSDVNPHFRAKAFIANKQVASACPPGACSPAQVVAAVRSAYGL